jgi:hypothetical protein
MELAILTVTAASALVAAGALYWARRAAISSEGQHKIPANEGDGGTIACPR